jgi:hypothetical protein
MGMPVAHAMQRAQVDQHVDEGILIGNCLLIAQFGTFDA